MSEAFPSLAKSHGYQRSFVDLDIAPSPHRIAESVLDLDELIKTLETMKVEDDQVPWIKVLIAHAKRKGLRSSQTRLEKILIARS
jgi:hypothetical protein